MAKPVHKHLLISAALALACLASLPASAGKPAAPKKAPATSAANPAAPAAAPTPPVSPQAQLARKYSPIQYCHGSSFPAVSWTQVRDFKDKHAPAESVAGVASKGRATDPSLTTIPKLEYPESMRVPGPGPDGAVAIMVAVGKDGLTTDALVVCSTDPAFSAAALAAVKAATFAPATRDGQPVESVATLPIDFHP